MFGSMFHSMNAALTTASARSKASRADNEIADHEKEVVAAMDFGVVSSLDGSPAASAAAAVLAEWYASHSIVRRLWAIEAAEAMRIVIMLEPTVDGDDTQPAWLANSSGWAQELRIRMHRIVHLELVNEPSQIEGAFHGSRALTAAISWRDPTTEIG